MKIYICSIFFLLFIFVTVILSNESMSTKQFTYNISGQQGYSLNTSLEVESNTLKQGQLFPVKVKLTNKSSKNFPLDYAPSIIIEKEGITDFQREVMGNVKVGHIYCDNDSEFVKKKFLKPEESIEFKVDITKLTWLDRLQSIDLRSEIFDLIQPGHFVVFAEIPINHIEKDKKVMRFFSSNRIPITFISK